MGVCTRKRVVYDISCKRLQFFVNMEALDSNEIISLYSKTNVLKKQVLTLLCTC